MNTTRCLKKRAQRHKIVKISEKKAKKLAKLIDYF